jgi:hypothetical protein
MKYIPTNDFFVRLMGVLLFLLFISYQANADVNQIAGYVTTSKIGPLQAVNVIGSNVGIGSTAPGSQLTISNGASHAGKALCVTTAGRVGYCSTVVSSSGGCTCTAL